jgi:hypothetical protein
MISPLEKEYLTTQQRRLKEAYTRFLHTTPQGAGLFDKLFLYNWLQQEIPPAYQKKSLALAQPKLPEVVAKLLLESPNLNRLLEDLISHLLKSGEENSLVKQLRTLLIQQQNHISQVVEKILTEWQDLGLFVEERKISIRRIQTDQKLIGAEVGGELDQQRVALVDGLPDRYARGDRFEKIGLIPHMACLENCRHCMFVWRPPLKNLPDPGPLLKMLSQKTDNILFTGGDLSKRLFELHRAIREMGGVRMFAILLNGTLASSLEKADDFFSQIRQALKKRPSQFLPAQVMIQISFDEFHQEIIVDREGKLKERIPISHIAHLLVAALSYPEIKLVLLHKQNRLNFSENLFKFGVFSRLSNTLTTLNHPIESIDWQTSPRAKADPINPQHTGGVIREVFFTLKDHPDRPFPLMSSTIDAYGRAALLDPSEYINERDYLLQILENGPPADDRFDIDPMVWYDGSVTLFSGSHIWLGNLIEEGEKLFTRYRKDPLLAALEQFDRRLLTYASHHSNSLEKLINQATGPHHLFHQLTQSAALRLALTKRLIEDL